jgi:hypothetical protein
MHSEVNVPSHFLNDANVTETSRIHRTTINLRAKTLSKKENPAMARSLPLHLRNSAGSPEWMTGSTANRTPEIRRQHPISRAQTRDPYASRDQAETAGSLPESSSIDGRMSACHVRSSFRSFCVQLQVHWTSTEPIAARANSSLGTVDAQVSLISSGNPSDA